LELNTANRVRTAGKQFAQLASNFKVVESDATREARTRVDALQAEAKKKIAEGRKEAEPEAYDYGQAIGEQIGKGLKDSKFDAVLRSSAEAISRMAHFEEIASGVATKDIGGKILHAEPAGHRLAQNDRIPDLLVQIRDELRNKEPVEFQEAGLA
jgi:hypothetical protein